LPESTAAIPVEAAHARFQADRYANCDAADWIERWAAASGFDDRTKFAMRLCVDELVTNAIAHGIPANAPDRTIEIAAAAADGQARIVVSDSGVPFDITTSADPGREGTIENATIGGRGIRLIRSFAEKLEWRRVDGRNETTLVFRTAPAPGR